MWAEPGIYMLGQFAARLVLSGGRDWVLRAKSDANFLRRMNERPGDGATCSNRIGEGPGDV